MDSSSWSYGYGANGGAAAGNSGFMCGYAASCVVPEGLMQSRKEEERTQIQHHLNQISMQMNMEDEPAPYIIPAGDGAAVGMQQSVLAELDFLPSHHTGGCSFPSSSSTSSSFRSASLSCSPENSSAHALKDKTSILITAREYVKSLKSKVCDLEEKNKALQAQLAECARAAGRVEEDDAEKVEIQITRAAADREDGTTTSEVCTVKIAARPAHGNTMDVVLRTLQCLNDQMGEEDVSLVAMSTSYGDGVNGLTGAFLTMQLKSASGAKWEEEVVREAVAKAVAARTGADRRGDAAGRSRHAE
ncbi:uncharacterized protein LOC119279376 [Triticum dicoccoides]|uniref:uncharacterized protein LOC119279376 n=1 Tax=Triticum dicoccoides TaxID=85692 RepID=UPI00188DCD48|nr:uncharacterized protein LOC119279376 [Triticum dicoccoides]